MSTDSQVRSEIELELNALRKQFEFFYNAAWSDLSATEAEKLEQAGDFLEEAAKLIRANNRSD